MKFIPSIVITSSFSLAGTIHAANLATDFLGSFNVFTGDYSFERETEGAIFAHGTYTPTAGDHNIGFNGGQVTNASENVLFLNNGVSGPGVSRLLSGSAVSRVSVAGGSIDLQQGGATLSQGETEWTNAITSLGIGSANSVSDLTSLLSDISQQWSGLTANSTATNPAGNSLNFNPTGGSGLSVFSIDANDFNGAGSLNITFPTGGTVLVNVSGSDVTVGGNFTGDFTNNESQIIFNFYEADTVNVNSNFRGNILAPQADVIQGGSNIDGGVYSASLTQNAEVHDLRFEGEIPFTPIPEPSSLLLLGLGSLGLFVRRRA